MRTPLRFALALALAACTPKGVTPTPTDDASQEAAVDATATDATATDAPSTDATATDAPSTDAPVNDKPTRDVQTDGADAAQTDGADAAQTDASDAAQTDASDAAPRCTSDRECSARSLVCGLAAGVCVECNVAADCAADQMCLGNRCLTPVACTTSRMCPGQVCSATLRACVDCDTNVDCATGQACVGNACITRMGCRTAMDCAAGQRCDAARSVCVACLLDADCGAGRLCTADNRCAMATCAPGAATCTAAGALSTCNARGDGFSESMCPTGQRCSAGACVMVVTCTPGSARCGATGRREVCNADGMGYTATDCASGERCAAGVCAPICTPGATRCGATRRERCATDGLVWEAAPCGTGTTCVGGNCVASCTAGATRCTSTRSVETCAADGVTWTPSTCGSSQVCALGGCRAAVCTLGATCGSTTAVRICADGLSETTVACPTGSACTGPAGTARCSSWACSPGDAPTCSPTPGSAVSCSNTGVQVTTACAARSGASVTCSAGLCVYACQAGFSDCDGNVANGCESLTSAQNCGVCGNLCTASGNYLASCAAGACARICPAGFADCDGSEANGCEADINTARSCGRCGLVCASEQTCGGGACITGRPTPAPLLDGFGGPAGYGTNCLHANDDGSWAGPPPTSGFPAVAIPLAPAFPMGLTYGVGTFTTFYVNTNGNISFRGAIGTYAPSPFPVADQPMIAPWWADVDTRGTTTPDNNNICFVVDAARVIVTWNRVGYFSSHVDRLNSFQLVLTRPPSTSASTDFDVEFRFNRCEWTTGDASGGIGGFGGTPAQSGFDFGDRRTHVSLPYNRTMQVLSYCTTSNVGIAGVWRFRVRGGAVLPM